MRAGGKIGLRRFRSALLVVLPLAVVAWFAVLHESESGLRAASKTQTRLTAARNDADTAAMRGRAGLTAARPSVDAAAHTPSTEAGSKAVERENRSAAATSGAASAAALGTRATTSASLAVQRERELPWRLPRQCKNEAQAERAARLLYLSHFRPTPVWRTVVYTHADTPAEAIASVTRHLESVHREAVNDLGLSARPAEVYVHPTAESMRQNSCAKANALAYYDGAIHLAPPPPVKPPTTASRFEKELQTSLRHEYVHHVLVDNGIGRPIWLQESLAMRFAGEVTFDTAWRAHPLPLRDMVDRLPSTSAPEVEHTFYPQAATMLLVLDRLCIGLEDCGHKQLPEALRQGRATPETLFEWTVEQRAQELLTTTPEALFLDYVARNDFSPQMLNALLARARARR